MNLRAWIPGILLLALLPCLLFPGALPGRRVVAASDHLTVHHVFRTADGPGGTVTNPEISDPALQFQPLRERVLATWRTGHPPLWNPDLHAGIPLLADAQSRALDPLQLLDLTLPGPVAADLRTWIVLAGAGVGTLLLAAALGASPAGAALAGVVSMLSAFQVGWLLHPHAMARAWIPWLAWSLVRATRRGAPPGSPLPVALTLAGLLTAGHPGTQVHGLLFAGLVTLGVALAPGPKRPPPRAWIGTVLGLLAGGLVAAPAWLPVLEATLRSTTVAAHGLNRIPAAALATLVLPDPFGHPARGTWQGPGSHLETNLHVGVVAVGLALWGLRRRAGQPWVAGALLALAVALGLPLLSWIPVNHARLGGIASLCLAVAAGLAVPAIRPAWGLVAAAALELLVARRSDQATVDPAAFSPPPAAWAVSLAERAAPGRVLGLGWAVQPDTGALAGLRDLRGYDLPVSPETERLMRALDHRLLRPWFPVARLTAENAGILRFAAVRYVLAVEADEAAVASLAGLPPVDLPGAPLVVAALDPEAPRAWLATAARPVATPEEGLRSTRLAEARNRPGVEVPPDLPPADRASMDLLRVAPAGPVRPVVIREPWPERVEVEVSTDTPALLVLADAWAPGWRVAVDDAPRTLLRVGGAFRGVLVGPEDRQAVFRYEPASWTLAVRLAAVGGVLLVGLGVGFARRR